MSVSPPVSSVRNRLIPLTANRVWRTYPGGATLDRLTGKPEPADSHLAEDWIGSVTPARNPGRHSPDEGISQLVIDDHAWRLPDLIATDPAYFLGASHVAKHGNSPALLVKFLDSAVRLHLQCHPTREFARAFLDSEHGKTEAYHILEVREGEEAPYIFAGFQRPPTRDQFRAWIEAQDIAGIESCFDRIPVRPGQTLLIPGGVPHALGPGVFMVEIQEPSDLVARFEFEKAGYVLPESARFMDRGIELALDMLDFRAYSPECVRAQFLCSAGDIESLGPHARRETLIGPDRTDCFRVQRTVLRGPAELNDDTYSINIVTAGTLDAHVAGNSITLQRFDKFFRPAGLGPVRLLPHGSAELLQCFPPC